LYRNFVRFGAIRCEIYCVRTKIPHYFGLKLQLVSRVT
jgi:hypothetical protein